MQGRGGGGRQQLAGVLRKQTPNFHRFKPASHLDKPERHARIERSCFFKEFWESAALFNQLFLMTQENIA
jgi:hypothetical protein